MHTVGETVETLEAEVAKDLEAYKKIQATNQATSAVLQHQYTMWKQGFDALEQQKKIEQAALDALNARQARLAAMKAEVAAKATKVGTGDYRKWIIDFIRAHQSLDESEGLDYNHIAEATFKAGVAFPGKEPPELKNVKRQVNRFLDDASKLWNPIPLIKKTKAGHYRLTANNGVPPSSTAREVIAIKVGPRDVPNTVLFEIVTSLVPTLLAKGPMVDTTYALNLFRDECKRQNIRFKNKEKAFNFKFVTLCGPDGPFECWKQTGSAPGTEVYQKAGGPPPPGEGWKLVTPQVPVMKAETPASNDQKPQASA